MYLGVNLNVMPQNKTQPTRTDVNTFLKQVAPQEKQQDCFTLLNLMEKITRAKPVLWGTAIVGFGSYPYQYASRRAGEWFLTGFSPRKHAISLYLFCDLQHPQLSFDNLGKHKRGKGCLYIKKCADINLDVLEVIIRKAIALTKQV